MLCSCFLNRQLFFNKQEQRRVLSAMSTKEYIKSNIEYLNTRIPSHIDFQTIVFFFFTLSYGMLIFLCQTLEKMFLLCALSTDSMSHHAFAQKARAFV